MLIDSKKILEKRRKVNIQKPDHFEKMDVLDRLSKSTGLSFKLLLKLAQDWNLQMTKDCLNLCESFTGLENRRIKFWVYRKRTKV